MKNPLVLLLWGCWSLGCGLAGVSRAAETAPAEPLAPAAQREGRPNVLLILTDDQGWGDLRLHGNEQIDTPVLDRLADQGARLNRFYVSPACAPTRAALLTGRYPMRLGVRGVTRGAETLAAEELTVAEVFRDAGYATGCFGKWHNGAHWPHHPRAQGFDEFTGFCGGHLNHYFDAVLEKNGETFASQGYITDVLTDQAIQFMTRHKDRPFFCYVPYNAPHAPYQVPEKYFQKYKQRHLSDELASVYGMVENIDDNVGRLLERLEELGLMQNTIVVFLSDNGPATDRYNGGLKGRKGSVDEGGVRVPCFVRYPGRIPAGSVIDPMVAHIDLLPTLVELAGLPELQPARELDGMSLAPLLDGRALNWPDRALITAWEGRVAVRTPGVSYLRNQRQWEAYRLMTDPRQQKNIVRDHADDLASVGHALVQELRAMEAEAPRIFPIQIGHAEARRVVFAAHEAFLAPAQGEGIDYSGPGGWANDWITRWTNEQAYPWWPLRVVRSGRYRLTALYTCDAANLGSELAVQAVAVKDGQAGEPVGTKPAILHQAHDPAPRPGPDRVPRKEAPEKAWAELPLGELVLESGEYRLDLRCQKKAGQQIADIKGLVVEWVGE